VRRFPQLFFPPAPPKLGESQVSCPMPTHFSQAFASVSLIEAANEREEATALAAAMRQALEPRFRAPQNRLWRWSPLTGTLPAAWWWSFAATGSRPMIRAASR
jgi:hypothetical protein